METIHDRVLLRQSAIHGTGLFAARALGPGTTLIEYVGRKIDKQESQHQCQLNNPYIFYLDDTCDLDGNVEWNPARFINHSCNPNCDAELVDGRIWIVTNRPVRAGEEITFDYGYDAEDYLEYPCRCGAPNCRGYIVAAEHAAAIRPSGP